MDTARRIGFWLGTVAVLLPVLAFGWFYAWFFYPLVQEEIFRQGQLSEGTSPGLLSRAGIYLSSVPYAALFFAFAFWPALLAFVCGWILMFLGSPRVREEATE